MAEASTPQPDQWWISIPPPRAKCPELAADEVMKMFDDMDIKPEPRPFLLVDVRRTDWEVRNYFPQVSVQHNLIFLRY